jgi:hypothetical protein
MVKQLRLAHEDEKETANSNIRDHAITGFWTTRGSSGVWGEHDVRVRIASAEDSSDVRSALGAGRGRFNSESMRIEQGGCYGGCGGCGGCSSSS